MVLRQQQAIELQLFLGFIEALLVSSGYYGDYLWYKKMKKPLPRSMWDPVYSIFIYYSIIDTDDNTDTWTYWIYSCIERRCY